WSRPALGFRCIPTTVATNCRCCAKRTSKCTVTSTPIGRCRYAKRRRPKGGGPGTREPRGCSRGRYPARGLVCQPLVLDAVGRGGVLAQAAPTIRLVLRVVALEPHHLTVALEGEDVRGDTVQEPAVVRDDDGAAGEGE